MLSLGGRYKEAMTNKTLRSFRVTTEDQTPVLDLLTMEGFRFEPEPFSKSCFRLVEEPFPLGSSLAAHFGYVYIQDRSSMLPPLALSPQRGAAVLDMCASPGSKTGFLAQMVGKNGFVLGNELSHSRLYTLRMNLQTTNAVCAGTCSFSGDAIPLVESSWKNILLDPPCSGWGTVEKNPKVLEVWREDKVRPLIVLQRRLLARAAALLAPGGTVVYSTCTTNSEENEQQVAWAEAEPRLRAFMRDKEQALVLENVAEVRSLLSGASMKTGLSGKEAGLWLKDLPLGRVSLRNGRVIAGFGK